MTSSLPSSTPAPAIFSHCHKCGSAYGAGSDSFPKTCGSCSHIHYRNAIPVAVGMVPCEDGLLGVIRGIEPQKNREALPGGFAEVETPEEACSRELFEESGVMVDPSAWRYQSSFLTPNGNVLLFFLADIEPIAVPAYPFPQLDAERPETLGFSVIRPGCDLAFSSHTAAAEAALKLLAAKADQKVDSEAVAAKLPRSTRAPRG